jgi:hypothetical protein
MLTIEALFRLLCNAKDIAEGSLRRLQDLHNRYPQDVPAEVIDRLVLAERFPGQGSVTAFQEESFPGR